MKVVATKYTEVGFVGGKLFAHFLSDTFCVIFWVCDGHTLLFLFVCIDLDDTQSMIHDLAEVKLCVLFQKT